MSLKAIVVAGVALFGFVGAASATPVTGQISIGGAAEGTTMGVATGMGTATGISFGNPSGTSVNGSGGSINAYFAGTGSFAALGACANTTTGCGTIQDISNFATQGALNSFLVLNTGTGPTVSFDLSSISQVDHPTLQDGGSVVFTASGTINFAGYDATAGEFILTAQGNNIVSFSATTLSTAVPEPASLALLGGGLTAIGLIRRRKNG